MVAQYLKLGNRYTSGIYVTKIILHGPSDGSGLKEGDIINKIDGKMLETMNDLKEYIYTKSPKDVVNIEYTRNRIKKTIQITLGKK